MEEYINTSIERYFNALSNTGYMPYSDVYKLIVVIFADELLNGEYKRFVTDDDNTLIHKALYCLYGSSCLTPYPEKVANTSVT